MNIITLLEHVANNVHHQIKIKTLISTQTEKVQDAFLNNDVASLRNQLGDTKNLANKNTIFQV